MQITIIEEDYDLVLSTECVENDNFVELSISTKDADGNPVGRSMEVPLTELHAAVVALMELRKKNWEGDRELREMELMSK